MRKINYEDYCIVGIAGNTPGHLEQVGETSDFEHISTSSANDPKCIFPIYTPNSYGELTSVFPISSKQIVMPNLGPLQLEPEVAIVFDIEYSNNFISKLKPKYAVAFNDCSIRIPDGNEKISRRKNWGHYSKGISTTLIKIDGKSLSQTLNSYRLCSFIIRNEKIYEYAVDTSATDYSFFDSKLISWIIKTINTQKDEKNLENILNLLKKANYPTKLIVSIGAIKYTPFGESNNIKSGDIGIIALYNSKKYSKEIVIDKIIKNDYKDSDISAIVLNHIETKDINV